MTDRKTSTDILTMARSCVHLDLENDAIPAMTQCIRSGEYREYGPLTGFSELRELIREDLRIDAPCEVCVTDGGVQALQHVIGWFSRGDKKHIFVDSDPTWVHSRNFARDMKKKLVPHKISPEDIPEGSVVNLCSPQNPVGFPYTPAEKNAIAERCRQVDAWLLCDDSYFVYEPEYWTDWKHVYNQYSERTIVIWSASKIGLAGVRVGAFVCNPKLMKTLVFGRANALGSSVLGQRAAIAALKSKDRWLRTLQQQVQNNTRYIADRLAPLGVTVTGISNSVNVSLPAQCKAPEVVTEMRSRGIEIAEGTKFCSPDDYNTNYIRLAVSVPRSWLERFCAELEELIDL